MRTRALLSLLGLLTIAHGQSPLTPGDRIEVASDSEPRLCRVVDLARNGSVSLPLLGSINAANLTLGKLEDLINQKLLADGRAVQVHIRRKLNPQAPISFAGALRYSGEISWAPGRRLSYVLSLATPTDYAELRQVEITDGEDGVLRIDASAVDFAGSPRDALLRPGDRILVPVAKVSNEVFVLGGVNRPGSVPFSDGLDPSKAIDAAGGLSGHGNPNDVWMERNGRRLPGLPALQRGDVLHVGLVEERQFVSVQGAVMRPGIVQFHDGMTLSQVIEAAGGVTFKADEAHVEVKSLLGRSDDRYDLRAIKNKKRKDVKLRASDIVDVPIQKTTKQDGS